MEKVTVTTIIDAMKGWVENKQTVSPHLWLDASAKLNVLRGDLDDALYTLEHNIAIERASLLSEPEMTVAKAKTFIEARPEFMESKKLRAKIKQVEEFIRIAKKFATLKDNDMQSN